jgi:integrase
MKLTKLSINKNIKKCKCIQSRLILSLLYYCGATSKDIIYLSYKDFNIYNKTVRLGYVEYQLPGHVITALCEHIAKTGNRNGCLFRIILNKPLYHKYIANIVSSRFGNETKPLHIRKLRIDEWMNTMPTKQAKYMARVFIR